MAYNNRRFTVGTAPTQQTGSQPAPTQQAGFQDNFYNRFKGPSGFGKVGYNRGANQSAINQQQPSITPNEKRDIIERDFNQTTPTYGTDASGNTTATRTMPSPYKTGGTGQGEDIKWSWVLPPGAMDFRLSQDTQPLSDAQRGRSARTGTPTSSGLRTEFPSDRFTEGSLKLPTDRFGNPLSGGTTDYTTGTVRRTGEWNDLSPLIKQRTPDIYERFRGTNPDLSRYKERSGYDTGKVRDYAKGKQETAQNEQRDQQYEEAKKAFTGPDGVVDYKAMNEWLDSQEQESKTRKRFREI